MAGAYKMVLVIVFMMCHVTNWSQCSYFCDRL